MRHARPGVVERLCEVELPPEALVGGVVHQGPERAARPRDRGDLQRVAREQDVFYGLGGQGVDAHMYAEGERECQ